MMRKFFKLIWINFLLSPIVFATPQFIASGPTKVPLIELYTSEGCSSCPPADRWLSSLKNDPRLWHDFVPIAFHVDYWDYIGWKDPFARKENSLRQRRYKREGNVNGVYTPGIIFMGQEWRTWYYEKTIPKINWSSAGNLTVTIDNGVALIKFIPAPTNSSQNSDSNSDNQKLRAHLSILGFDLTSDIKRGENKGKVLAHEFVSLQHLKTQPIEALTTQDNQASFSWSLEIPQKYWNTHQQSNQQPKRQFGIAVWVSGAKKQQPIQSLGGWLE